MRLDIEKILNTPDEVEINKKIFKMQEFTLKQRLEFSGMLQEQKSIVEKMFVKNPAALLGKFQTKDIFDFKLLKFIFTSTPQEQEFTEEDFNTLSTKQVKYIVDHVLTVNDFLKSAPPKEIKE